MVAINTDLGPEQNSGEASALTTTLTTQVRLDDLIDCISRATGVRVQLDWARLLEAGIGPDKLVYLDLGDMSPEAVLDYIIISLSIAKPDLPRLNAVLDSIAII